jgi:hypothetical protein
MIVLEVETRGDSMAESLPPPENPYSIIADE